MSALFPDIEAEVHAAAASHRPRRTPSRRLTARTVAIALLATTTVSGAAFAARSTWQPFLGLGESEPSTIPQDQREQLGILRREQTDGDRGVSAEYSLQFTASDYRVRLGSVRSAPPTPRGHAVVVSSNVAPSGQSVICLWIQDPEEAGGRACGTTDAVAAGEVYTLLGTPTDSAGFALIPKQRGIKEKPAELPQLVGIAPDGVKRVRVVGGEVDVIGNVRDNTYALELPNLPDYKPSIEFLD